MVRVLLEKHNVKAWTRFIGGSLLSPEIGSCMTPTVFAMLKSQSLSQSRGLP